MTEAACKGKGPDAFFLERGQSVAPGKKICAPCPVKAQCNNYAARTGTEYGMWGGQVKHRGRN